MRTLLFLFVTTLRAQDLQTEAWCAPSAASVTHDARELSLTCDRANRVDVFDLATRQIARHTPTPAATLDSPDGRWLYLARQFQNEVAILDASTRKEVARIPVAREPISLALTRDGRTLFVANSIPAMRADKPPVAAEITVIDTASRQATAHILLPNGATGVRQIRISPDGSTAAVTHLLARYFVPTTQPDRGSIQTNALSLIDVATQKLRATVLLDEIDRGAANPWAVEWTDDGKYLCVTHAGTHELSIIDAPALDAKLSKAATDPAAHTADDLAFLLGIRRRIPLSLKGPRTLAIKGHQAWIAGYFDDVIEQVDLDSGLVTCLRGGTPHAPGESLFNDASISFQGWLSCASCHGPHARVDGLNWDLLNDGIGDPINTKSLLLAHRTPPSMSHAVRENAEAAVRAGLEHILFARRPEAEAAAIDDYLKSLKPLPSPYPSNSAAARGKKLFFDRKVGCAKCHPAGLYTSMKSYDVGSGTLDTPTLIEIWRTAPYLHDGSAPTLRDVLTTSNSNDRHGRTSHLSATQIDDLIAWLLTL